MREFLFFPHQFRGVLFLSVLLCVCMCSFFFFFIKKYPKNDNFNKYEKKKHIFHTIKGFKLSLTRHLRPYVYSNNFIYYKFFVCYSVMLAFLLSFYFQFSIRPSKNFRFFTPWVPREIQHFVYFKIKQQKQQQHKKNMVEEEKKVC